MAKWKLALCAVLLWGSVFTSSASVVPLLHQNGVPIIPVLLPGIEVPITFVLDSGAGYNFIVSEIIFKMVEAETAFMIGKQKQNFIRSVDGGYHAVTLFLVPSLFIGDCEFVDITVAVFRGLEANLLGDELLQLMSPVLLDYEKGQLTFPCLLDEDEPE